MSEPACSSSTPLFELATAGVPRTDLAVPIRNRSHLVYSWSPELPTQIHAPDSPLFPLVALAKEQEGGEPLSIAEYAEAARSILKEHLTSHGAVLLRGMPLSNGEDFSKFVGALGWEAVKLGGGGTQRSDVAKGVRTASDEPPEQTIEPHMDMAHSKVHPKRIAFFCLAGPPPGVGGETVLTDMRAVYRTLSGLGIPQEFEARGGVAYRKQLWSSDKVAHDYTWQKFFFTKELQEAKRQVLLRDGGARVNEDDGFISFSEVLPASPPHPATGEPTWFNGVHTNHRSYYEEAKHVDTSNGSPMDTEYADGSAIDEQTIALIRAAYWNHSVALRMQDGDITIVDNMLASHGRMGWVPGYPRKVLLTHFTDSTW